MEIGIQLYHDYIKKRDSCIGVFKVVSDYFEVKRGLYPGSYIHITPSLIIPEMHYVDTDKKAICFFKQMDEIKEYVENNKTYEPKTQITFDGVDYWTNLSVSKSYDLLISLYSGFISQATKKYLRLGGILLTNDSHGDATRAFFDTDYVFVAVVSKSNGSYKIDTTSLENYFIQRSGKPVDIEKVIREMKGPKYKMQSDYYLFKKVK